MSWEPDRKVRRCQEDYDAGFRAAIAGLDKTVPPEIDTWDFVRRNAWLIGWSDGHTHMRCTSNLIMQKLIDDLRAGRTVLVPSASAAVAALEASPSMPTTGPSAPEATERHAVHAR